MQHDERPRPRANADRGLIPQPPVKGARPENDRTHSHLTPDDVADARPFSIEARRADDSRTQTMFGRGLPTETDSASAGHCTRPIGWVDAVHGDAILTKAGDVPPVVVDLCSYHGKGWVAVEPRAVRSSVHTPANAAIDAEGAQVLGSELRPAPLLCALRRRPTRRLPSGWLTTPARGNNGIDGRTSDRPDGLFGTSSSSGRRYDAAKSARLRSTAFASWPARRISPRTSVRVHRVLHAFIQSAELAEQGLVNWHGHCVSATSVGW